MPTESEHALIVEIHGASLPERDELLSEIVRLEATLAAALNGIGIVDGHDFGLMLGQEGGGVTGASIYVYGENATAMLAAVEPVLQANPMSSGCVVRLREGKPGTEEKRVEIQPSVPSHGARLQ